jgi:hypothetical protein
MPSAPAAVPAMTEVSFAVAFPAPDFAHCQTDMLVQQPRQPGPLSQLQQRHQTRTRHEIVLIEHAGVFDEMATRNAVISAATTHAAAACAVPAAG